MDIRTLHHKKLHDIPEHSLLLILQTMLSPPSISLSIFVAACRSSSRPSQVRRWHWWVNLLLIWSHIPLKVLLIKTHTSCRNSHLHSLAHIESNHIFSHLTQNVYPRQRSATTGSFAEGFCECESSRVQEQTEHTENCQHWQTSIKSVQYMRHHHQGRWDGMPCFWLRTTLLILQTMLLLKDSISTNQVESKSKQNVLKIASIGKQASNPCKALPVDMSEKWHHQISTWVPSQPCA